MKIVRYMIYSFSGRRVKMEVICPLCEKKDMRLLYKTNTNFHLRCNHCEWDDTYSRHFYRLK